MGPVTGLIFNSVGLLKPHATKPKPDDAVIEDKEDSNASENDEDENAANGDTSISPETPIAASPLTKATAASDARLLELKKQGYSDAAVADRLTKEGHRVQTKTVIGRWRRIRAQLDKEADERLDDELSDWHEGEDYQLRSAYLAADAKYKKEVQKLEAVRWKDVRRILATSLDKNKYTAKACKERYEALENGTAELPIELDSDQEGRAKMRIARIARNKCRRAEAVAEAAFISGEKKRATEEEKLRKYNHRVNILQYRDERKAEKEEIRQLKLDAARGREAERQRRAKVLARVRAEAAETKRIKLAEDRVYRYYTGRDLIRKHRSGWRTGRHDDSEDDEVLDFLNDSESEDATSIAADSVMGVGEKEKRKVKHDQPANVTKGTLLNPRSIMTTNELDILLFERGVRRRGPVESHPEVVARLAAADKDLKSVELDVLLEKHFVRLKGNMKTRIDVLQKADAANSAAGKIGWDVNHHDFKKGYDGYNGKYGHLLDDK